MIWARRGAHKEHEGNSLVPNHENDGGSPPASLGVDSECIACIKLRILRLSSVSWRMAGALHWGNGDLGNCFRDCRVTHTVFDCALRESPAQRHDAFKSDSESGPKSLA